MLLNRIMLTIIITAALYSCSLLKQKSSAFQPAVTSTAPTDTLNKNKPKPYRDVITAKAITDSGLFIIHRLGEKYFFEIPDSLLGRDILIVSRIARAAANVRPDMFWGYAGDQIGERVMKFTKGPNNKLFVNLVFYIERTLDSSENSMQQTVNASNLMPIVAAFDIKAYAKDSSASVIDVTEFMSADNQVLNFDAKFKALFKLGTLQKDRSYITDIKSFPINVELRSIASYSRSEETVTYELNNSFLLLPKQPMNIRFRDKRVGYFFRSYVDYDEPQRAGYGHMITRWRLEPKEVDKDNYLKGELVEPKKPIIFYIDPATPKKWVPYLIQGVNDWQKAFEKAGFKNAIYALEAPRNDPAWSLYDARHNAIVYKASIVPNASGPNVNDPRSGEILESHINWYHNVMELLHDWYLIQASPNDPQARKMVYDDSLMGKLIRFVCAHEVGHTLGLAHNFGASSTVPVDSLRSRKYVEKNGFCPSIMDYARFNYIAQPQDGFTQDELFPKIGDYDKWAIEWGYRWFPKFKTNDEEKSFINKWIISKLNDDKRLWYGPQDVFNEIVDPRSQYEDLGDNAMIAGNYAIENLKKVYANLLNWTKEPNDRYESLARVQFQIINWYMLYLFHACNNIGLYETTEKTREQEGTVIDFVSKQKQKQAVEFLDRHLLQTPSWLLNKEVFLRSKLTPVSTIATLQFTILYHLFNFSRYYRMEYFRAMQPGEAYTFDELLTDMRKAVFAELKNKSKIDFHRRNLQALFVEKMLIEANTYPSANKLEEIEKIWEISTGYNAIFKTHINKCAEEIAKALPSYKDEESRQHLMLLRQKLKQAIAPGAQNTTPNQSVNTALNFIGTFNYPPLPGELGRPIEDKNLPVMLNCWQFINPFFNATADHK